MNHAAVLERRAERREQRRRLDQIRVQTQQIVAAGVCPYCGSKLRRNLALAGWWQCEQYGADDRRARAHEPPCSWQGFTR